MRPFVNARWPALLPLLFIAWATPVIAQDLPEIGIGLRNNVVAITVSNLPQETIAALTDAGLSQEKWQSFFPVKTINDAEEVSDQQPNVLGHYELIDDEAYFTPKYPFSEQIAYRVEFRFEEPNGKTGVVTFDLRLSHIDSNKGPTRVHRVYPSANILPANLLKFYIKFSDPMSRGSGFDYIKIVRDDGSIVEDPFPEIGVELWDLKQKRFTVLLDPGRIKRGIRINEEMGLPLVPGESYRLVVDGAWPDAEGEPLEKAYSKAFKVVEPDYESPDPTAWVIQAPKVDTREPLKITFKESLDAALIQRLIWLTDAEGTEVQGHISADTDETRCEFRPTYPWNQGEYTLRVHPRLEDLAGNQVSRPFEIDASKGSRRTTPEEEVSLPFVIR